MEKMTYLCPNCGKAVENVSTERQKPRCASGHALWDTFFGLQYHPGKHFNAFALGVFTTFGLSVLIWGLVNLGPSLFDVSEKLVQYVSLTVLCIVLGLGGGAFVKSNSLQRYGDLGEDVALRFRIFGVGVLVTLALAIWIGVAQWPA